MADTIICATFVALLGLWFLVTRRHKDRGISVPAPWKGFFVIAAVLFLLVSSAVFRFEYLNAKTDADIGQTVQVCRQSVDEARALYEASITELAKEVPGDVGICFYDALEDLTIEYNGTAVFETASLYKLYVAWAVLDDVQTGKRTLADEVPGWGGSIQEGIKDMITWSDNDSAEALGTMVKWSRIDELLHSKGLKQSTFHPSEDGNFTDRIESTPRDLTIFLAMLTRGSILDESRTAFLVDMLLKQELNNTLSPGLSDNLRYGHKTGWLDDCFNDAGIIYVGDRPFFISVMTTGWTSGSPAAEDWYTRLGHATSAYINAVSAAEQQEEAARNGKLYNNDVHGFTQWILYNRHAKNSLNNGT